MRTSDCFIFFAAITIAEINMAQWFSSRLIMNTITIIIMINNNILKDGLTTHELFWSRSLLIQFSTSWQKDLLLKYLQVIQK